MASTQHLASPTAVKQSPLIKKIPTIQLASDPNAVASNFIPTSLLASTGTVMPLSLISNPYLTGQANNQPSFSQLLSMGLVSSAKAVSEDWITVSGQSVVFNYPSYLVFDNDFYQMPPCSLSVSSTDVVSVLYVAKSRSGMSPLESQIGLIQTKAGLTAEEALSYADGQITSVYMPLAVLSGDENGNQTLLWELDQNSQFAAPVLNQFVLLQDFEANAKEFLTSQFTALYNDLTSFASWSSGWINTPFQANFNMPQNITNYVNPINWGGEGINGVTYTGNSINVNCFTRTLSMCLIGVVWGNQANNGDTGAWEGWSEAFNAPLIYSQIHGSLESQFANLIPNFSSYTGSNFYYAPSVDLGLQGALITNEGNSVGPGASYWQKTVIWSSTDGNLYTHVGNGSNYERDWGVPYSLVIPANVSIRLVNGDTGEDVVAMPTNPLANPTFNPAWQNSN